MKRQQIIAAVLALIVLAVATFQASRPDAGQLKFKVRDNIAYGYGGTNSRSYGVVKKLVQDHPQVDTIVLKHMPGTQDAVTNLKIARNIRKAGLKTHLESRSFIASGAVDLFLAGTERTMECGAMIGVHTHYVLAKGGLVRGKSYHPRNTGYDSLGAHVQKFHIDMGISPDFYAFTRDAALPEELYYLTPADIARFGLLTTPLNCP
ncbi:hypothetical protein DES40_1982 [Litorimonas taeanensis]|uniref:Uncharacterized protein n=1 Tax=Litorimonas taeanensis TaxID=568099 RepID=A0A420WDW1_9PROT|nr:hypothetical protein [Litorimonas taeanensis]RKQ69183.1 hypothetical protein DES40_1982 [Litorimonas taeanensis]